MFADHAVSQVATNVPHRQVPMVGEIMRADSDQQHLMLKALNGQHLVEATATQADELSLAPINHGTGAELRWRPECEAVDRRRLFSRSRAAWVFTRYLPLMVRLIVICVICLFFDAFEQEDMRMQIIHINVEQNISHHAVSQVATNVPHRQNPMVGEIMRADSDQQHLMLKALNGQHLVEATATHRSCSLTGA